MGEEDHINARRLQKLLQHMLTPTKTVVIKEMFLVLLAGKTNSLI